jgi:hypothetical protein
MGEVHPPKAAPEATRGLGGSDHPPPRPPASKAKRAGASSPIKGGEMSCGQLVCPRSKKCNKVICRNQDMAGANRQSG